MDNSTPPASPAGEQQSVQVEWRREPMSRLEHRRLLRLLFGPRSVAEKKEE